MCFAILSCKKEIIVNIDNKPPKLVVNGMFSSDSLMRIHLSITQNITDNNNSPNVDNAIIEVLDEDSVLQEVLLFKGSGDYASNTLKPLPGKTYLLRINNGSNVHWVNERMPDTLSTNLVDTSRGVIFQGNSNFFQFEVAIKDPISQNNYYSLKLKRTYNKISGVDTVKAEEWVNIESKDFVLTENPESKFSKKHLLFNDLYFQGSNLLIKFGAADLFTTGGQQTLKLDLYISSYSESGYNFYTSVNEHLLYQNDPFSQPTLLQGNVSNAFGAAIGIYTTKYTVVFPK